ncbi:MAG TPA: DedA family protein [Tepidisphaeraceae bacterium]|nr:DedA family protein [Tepidisphaeraceae bacterium]
MDFFGLDIFAALGGQWPLASAMDRILGWMDIGWWGYLVLFFLLFTCGFGSPIPEDVPILVAGMLIGTGKMHLVPVAICAWAGIMIGDCLLYYFGHRIGHRITKMRWIGKHMSASRIEQAERLFANYGVWVVAIGRMLPGVRGAMVVGAGTIRYGFWKFFTVDGIAAVVSGGLFIWLGMKFGENLPTVRKYEHVVTWSLLGAVVAFILYQWWRHSGHRGVSEVAADVVEKVAIEGIHLPGVHLGGKDKGVIGPTVAGVAAGVIPAGNGEGVAGSEGPGHKDGAAEPAARDGARQ